MGGLAIKSVEIESLSVTCAMAVPPTDLIAAGGSVCYMFFAKG